MGNMDRTADVVIIGGGVIGVSIAYHLTLKKAGRVVLLEKGQLGEGSTSRCAGWYSHPIFHGDQYSFLP